MNPFPPAINEYINVTMPKMEGWCSPQKASALAAHVLDRKCRVCVEIGVYAGRSFFAIALALKHLGTGFILGIDPWNPDESVDGFEADPPNRDWWGKLDHNAIYQKFDDDRQRLGVESCTEVFVGGSDQAFPSLKLIQSRFSEGKPYIDLLHIDGNHSIEHALFDVENYVPLVVANGVVFLDDLDWESTKAAQKRLAEFCLQKGEVGTCGIFTPRSTLLTGQP